MQHASDFHGLIFLEHLIEHIVILHRNPSHFLQHREPGMVNRMAIWYTGQALDCFINLVDKIERGLPYPIRPFSVAQLSVITYGNAQFTTQQQLRFNNC